MLLNWISTGCYLILRRLIAFIDAGSLALIRRVFFFEETQRFNRLEKFSKKNARRIFV